MSASLRDLRLLVSVGLAAFVLSACTTNPFSSNPFSSSEPTPPPSATLAPEIPASIRPEEIVGRWGYGAYHNETDRARTEAAARGQCGQPVLINRGPNGGVMMYLADSAQLQELNLKGSPSGKNYIGPPGPAGIDQPGAERRRHDVPRRQRATARAQSQRQSERQELYRSARAGRRRARSRNCLVRRPHHGSALDESRCGDPLWRRRVCALRAGRHGALKQTPLASGFRSSQDHQSCPSGRGVFYRLTPTCASRWTENRAPRAPAGYSRS